MDINNRSGPDPDRKNPVLNVPYAILGLLILLVLIHLYRTVFIGFEDDLTFLLQFSFIPARYNLDPASFAVSPFPGGVWADIWTFITYSLLHADWLHLTINGFWLLIFGSALIRRFGAGRFIVISALGAVGGAGAHIFANWGELRPMVGASAVISAHMACAARFAFVPYGPLGRPRSVLPQSYYLPSLSITQMIQNTSALSFIVIWFAINLIFGLGSNSALTGETASIAWQAHIGGFAIGLFLFPLFDPVK